LQCQKTPRASTTSTSKSTSFLYSHKKQSDSNDYKSHHHVSGKSKACTTLSMHSSDEHKAGTPRAASLDRTTPKIMSMARTIEGTIARPFRQVIKNQAKEMAKDKK